LNFLFYVLSVYALTAVYLANRIIALSGFTGKYSAAAVAAAYAEKIVGGGGESHDPKNRRRRGGAHLYFRWFTSYPGALGAGIQLFVIQFGLSYIRHLFV